MTSRSIIWRNATATVTLLDIPGSIGAAQAVAGRCLLSSPPLQDAYPSTEPKSAVARARVEERDVDAEVHRQYQHVLQDAIEEIRAHFHGEWCYPRSLSCDQSRPQKRKLDINPSYGHDVRCSGSVTDDLEKQTPEDLSALARRSGVLFQVGPVSGQQPRIEDYLLFDHFVANETDEQVLLHLRSSPLSDRQCTYILPPRSSLCLGDCADPDLFHNALARPGNLSSRQFDFILIDPPWPNRSVRRTHKTPGSTYATSPTVSDIRHLILNMRLDHVMADDCLVAIWITNRASVRALVLDPETGLFARWGLDLVEEWLWLKTTARGEPVFALDALWRKPYEVLLVGRKRSLQRADTVAAPSEAPTRRVIVGVPDLHSRKPCLKELIEPLMADSAAYGALEVFARHLVAGWWSWGDECIKFNWAGYWRDEEQTFDAASEQLRRRGEDRSGKEE